MRGELPDLLKGIHQREGILTDEMQFVPQAIERSTLRIIEDQSPELLVLAMEQGQRHHLISRNDLGIAQRGGEQAAEVIEGPFEPLTCGASILHQDR